MELLTAYPYTSLKLEAIGYSYSQVSGGRIKLVEKGFPVKDCWRPATVPMEVQVVEQA